jgi:hypothetical protein
MRTGVVINRARVTLEWVSVKGAVEKIEHLLKEEKGEAQGLPLGWQPAFPFDGTSADGAPLG